VPYLFSQPTKNSYFLKVHYIAQNLRRERNHANQKSLSIYPL